MKNRTKKPTSPRNPKNTEIVDQMRIARQNLEQAEGLRLQKNFDRAEKICAGLLRKNEDYYGAAHTMGLIMADRGNHKRAAQYLNRAAILNPSSWSTLTSLAAEYLELDSYDLALKTALEALEIQPEKAVIHQLLGEINLRLRELKTAQSNFEKAKILEPDILEVRLGFVRVSLDLGDFQVAAKELEKLSKTHPQSLGFKKLYFDLPDEFANQTVQKQITMSILDGSQNDKDTASRRAFLKSRAFEALGDAPNAWASAVKANQLVSEEHSKDIKLDIAEIRTRTNWLIENKGRLNTTTQTDPDLPISLFIFGPSRSGKTTLESLLGNHPNVVQGYENPIIRKSIQSTYHDSGFFPVASIAQLPPQFYSNFTKLYADSLSAKAKSAKVFTNTAPGYLWDAPFFHSAVPNSRFVFVKRNIEDLMWRIFTKSYRAGNWYAYDLASLKEYIINYYLIVDLMADLLPKTVRVINYEDIVQNPTEISATVLKDCGLNPIDLGAPTVGNDVGCSDKFKIKMEELIAG